MQIQEFLKEQEDELERLYVAVQACYWVAAISGKDEEYKKYEAASLNFKKFFNNKENFEIIKGFMGKKMPDKLASRELLLFYNSYLANQGDLEILKKITALSTQIEKKFNTFRAKIDGKDVTDNEIKDILRKEQDSRKLEEAWNASKKQGKLVEGEVLELVKLRNQLAKSVGFSNYYEMSLETNEQAEKDIERIFLELEKLTDKPFRKLKKEMDSFLAKKYKISEKNLGPWHYGDLFFQEGPSVYEIDLDSYYKEDILEKAKKYYSSIGLNVQGILDRSDLYEKPGKYQHACCMDMDRRGDVRTIQNLKNSERWMETLLHELGHGVYSENIDRTLPFMLIDSAHIFTTEAIAMLFGRKSKNAEFIRNYCNADEKEVKKIKEITGKISRLRQLVFCRWTQVMFHFERALYKNPEQDLNKLWWELVKKYQLIDFSRDMPDWASKFHIVTSPAYYHNYMLGEMLASQLHFYMAKNFLEGNRDSDYSGKKQVGDYLIEKIFKPGAKYRWDELIEKATGEKLTSRYFVEEFAAG